MHLSALAAPSDTEGPGWIDRIQTYVHLARNISLMIAFVFLAATFLMLIRRLRPAQTGASAAAEPAVHLTTGRNGVAGTNVNGAALNRQQLMELANTDPRQVARLLSNLMRTNGAAR